MKYTATFEGPSRPRLQVEVSIPDALFHLPRLYITDPWYPTRAPEFLVLLQWTQKIWWYCFNAICLLIGPEVLDFVDHIFLICKMRACVWASVHFPQNQLGCFLKNVDSWVSLGMFSTWRWLLRNWSLKVIAWDFFVCSNFLHLLTLQLVFQSANAGKLLVPVKKWILEGILKFWGLLKLNSEVHYAHSNSPFCGLAPTEVLFSTWL